MPNFHKVHQIFGAEGYVSTCLQDNAFTTLDGKEVPTDPAELERRRIHVPDHLKYRLNPLGKAAVLPLTPFEMEENIFSDLEIPEPRISEHAGLRIEDRAQPPRTVRVGR